MKQFFRQQEAIHDHIPPENIQKRKQINQQNAYKKPHRLTYFEKKKLEDDSENSAFFQNLHDLHEQSRHNSLHQIEEDFNEEPDQRKFENPLFNRNGHYAD